MSRRRKTNSAESIVAVGNDAKKTRKETAQEATFDSATTAPQSPTPSAASEREHPSTLQRAHSVPTPKLKERNIPSKDNFFMSLAKVASARSRDPSMQVGACLVDSKLQRVLGIGYNGAPSCIDDKEYPWGLVEKDNETYKCKNDFVIHAEANALALSDSALHVGSTMYCTHYPCKDCAKTMIHAGVKRIVYLDDSRKMEKAYEPSVRLLNFAADKLNVKNQKYDASTEKTLMVQDVEYVKANFCVKESGKADVPAAAADGEAQADEMLTQTDEQSSSSSNILQF